MKKYFLFNSTLIFLLASTASVFSQSKNDFLGYWYFTENKNSPTTVVNIFEKGSKFYAYAFTYKDSSLSATEVHENMRGVVFAYDLKFENGDLVDGEIYEPSSNKHYYFKGKLEDNNNEIKWRASIDKTALFGANLIWYRVKDPQKYKILDVDFESVEKTIPERKKK